MHVNVCIDYIYHTTSDVMPVNRELLLAQAALESAWGTSRFALEGNNLFGMRTYDLREPHMLPWKDKPKKWGVKVFQHECDSVQNYMDVTK
jgi:Bax protein